jgi:hypothetical protein
VKNFGKDAIETAHSYYNLGVTLGFLGENRRAADLVKKAMPIFKKNYPKNHSFLGWATKMHTLLEERRHGG